MPRKYKLITPYWKKENTLYKTEHLNCLECGWEGDIAECEKEKEWSEHAGGGYIAVPHCPTCGSEHLADYDSQSAKDARMTFLGHE